MTEDQTLADEAASDEEEVAVAAKTDEGQDTDDQPAEEQEGDKPDDSEEEISRSKARRERRKAEMERLRASEAEAQKELEKAKDRIARLETKTKALQPPKESDFTDYAEYQAELAAFKSVRALDDRTKAEMDAEAQEKSDSIKQIEAQRQKEVVDHWHEQVVDARTRYADFEQVAFTAPISDAVTDIIIASDQAADVAYYLGKHRAEAQAISSMSALDAARAIGHIEARLSLPKAKVETQAPDPITPVKAKASAGMKDPDKMTFAEYKAARAAGKI